MSGLAFGVGSPLGGGSKLAEVRRALLAWVKASTGLDDKHAFFADQAIGAPGGIYVVLRVTDVSPLGLAGQDPVRWYANPGTPWVADLHYSVGAEVVAGPGGGNLYRASTAGRAAPSGSGPSGTGTGIADGTVAWDFVRTWEDCELRVEGQRQVTVSVQVWGASTVGDASAMDVVAALKGGLSLPSVRRALRAAGVAVFDTGVARNLSELLATQFEGRAQFDVKAYYAEAFSEYVKSFQKVTLIDVDDQVFLVENPG